jgi:hypothetical protein
MANGTPLTIEVLGECEKNNPVVVDRVKDGTIYWDEAKRIGRRLPPKGFRILSCQQVLYEWHVGDDEATGKHAG